MRISAIEKYGLRCLLVLARKGQETQISISEIAELEGLSVPYVSKLLSILRKSDLVKAARGRSGGFSIARPPADIDLYEVVTALDGPVINPDHCSTNASRDEECVHMDNCSVHDILGGLSGLIKHFLSQTTLEDLIKGEKLNKGKPGLITASSIVSDQPKLRKRAQSNTKREKQNKMAVETAREG
jgi:Rrf2 family iron-sulfur cluster assembly transcriptional regulator